jgi:hypothetical protein
MVKRHPQGKDYKILFLDDLFIGLDIANRLPLLKILKDQFDGYQIFTTTYDRPWYEYAKHYVEKESNWKCIEFYCKKHPDGFDMPVIKDHDNGNHVDFFLNESERHYNDGDYKASAVYLRTAFECLLKKICLDYRLPIKYVINENKLNTDHFLKTVFHKKDRIIQYEEIDKQLVNLENTLAKMLKTDFSEEIKGGFSRIHDLLKQFEPKNKGKKKFSFDDYYRTDIEKYRKLVMNPMSHGSETVHIFKTELRESIDLVRSFKNEFK